MFRRALPLLAATLLVACSGGDEPGAAPATDAPASAPFTTDAPAGGSSAGGSSAGGSSNVASAVPAALQLSAPLVGGGEIELGEFAGRPVLLWFWAPW